jgi:DNA-binding response OmpR family regulator
MRVLIIDDEPHIRQMMRLTLESSGYQVEEADDGEAGLARLRDGAAYDAIVLDQKMPGLDGLQTLRLIRERTPDACVLMVTAYASIELAVDAMKLGATDFLRKPMTPEMLRSAVVAAIAVHPAGRSAATRPAGPAGMSIQTLNGFQIVPVPRPGRPASPQHAFVVKHIADGAESTVVVSIDPEAVDRVARLTQRRLEPGGAFWHLQAERLVSAYVWTEGKPPADGRLTVRDISREDLDVAARWEQN